jgi:Cytidylate kinase-like family
MAMNKTTPELFGEALQRTRQRWRSQRGGEPVKLSPASKRVGVTVAISRETGALGGTVARELGAQLDWPVYDRELLEKISEESGLQAELLESLDEQESNRAAEWLRSLFGALTISTAEYGRLLLKTVTALAARGHCVIVGRGAALILPESSTLRVRLVAPRKTRAERERAKVGLADETAGMRHVDKIDTLRAEFVRDQFHKDVSDVHHYDMVLNSARFSVSQCADLIVAALRHI